MQLLKRQKSWCQYGQVNSQNLKYIYIFSTIRYMWNIFAIFHTQILSYHAVTMFLSSKPNHNILDGGQLSQSLTIKKWHIFIQGVHVLIKGIPRVWLFSDIRMSSLYHWSPQYPALKWGDELVNCCTRGCDHLASGLYYSGCISAAVVVISGCPALDHSLAL